MDEKNRNAAGRKARSLSQEDIGRLIREAENVDQDAVEALPALAREIGEASAALRYARGEIESGLLLARYAAMKDDYIEAVRLSAESLRMFEETGDAMGRVKAMSTLGFAYGQLGKLDEALGYFLEGLKLFNGSGFSGEDAEGIKGNLLNNLASIYGDLGRADEALEVLQEVQRQAEKVGGAPLVVALSNVCEAYLNKGDVMSALVYNQRALMEIRTKNLGNMHLYACHCSFGKIYERSGEPDKALASWAEALECAQRMNNRFSTASAKAAVGALHLKLGNRAEAATALNAALTLAEEIKAAELQRTAHGLLVELSEAARDFEKAYRHLRQYADIDRALETREIERRLSNYSADLKIEQIRKDAEIYRLKNVELKQKSEEVEQKARELEASYRNIKTISEIGQKITTSLDAETVLDALFESAKRLKDADILAVGLYDSAMDMVDYRMVVEGGKRQPLFQVSAEDPHSLASQVVKTGKPVMLGDNKALFTENAAMRGAAEGKLPKSIICCALKSSGRVMGVFTVQSYRPAAYTEGHLETMQALASYVAIALNNARQSEELKAKATELELASHTDVLTGLNNRRHMQEKIEEERIRFQRSARPFSIIICDIDYFKKVNDVYGHDCGDDVLRALAVLLGRHIRKQDCLARWGGEEFLLLLPETNKAGAAVLAEKLRRRVEENEFTYAGLKLPITMTFGLAEYNNEYGVDACIVGADSALYKGKQSGRNCVVAF